MIATFWDIAAEHIASFLAGVVVGFALTSRYRLVRKSNNGGPHAGDT
jgi:hypothetical protein